MNIMKMLANYYIVGIIVSSIVIVGLYVLISTRLVITSRRKGINVCGTGFIPIYNLTLLIRQAMVSKRLKKEELARIETERVTAKAEELGKTIEEVYKLEAKERAKAKAKAKAKRRR